MADLTTAKDGHVAERLKQDKIIWLGSVRPDGRPHMVPVWFDWDGTQLTVFTEPSSKKIDNIRDQPHVILALDDTYGGEDVVLFEGEATLSTDSAADVLTPAYLTKYAGGIEQMNVDSEKLASQFSQVIRIRPTHYMGW